MQSKYYEWFESAILSFHISVYFSIIVSSSVFVSLEECEVAARTKNLNDMTTPILKPSEQGREEKASRDNDVTLSLGSYLRLFVKSKVLHFHVCRAQAGLQNSQKRIY